MASHPQGTSRIALGANSPRRKTWLVIPPWWVIVCSCVLLAHPRPAAAQTTAILLPPTLDGATEIQVVEKRIPQEQGARPADVLIQLDLPSPDQVFRVDSEAAFRERLRREAREQKLPIDFPKDATNTAPPTAGVVWGFPPRSAVLVPSVLCYRPLYFEDRNTERYGWTTPGLQPLISTGRFYLHTLLLPWNLIAQPSCGWECNSGYPLPGDPVPFIPALVRRPGSP